MNSFKRALFAALATLFAAGAGIAQANIRITEVAPWSSGSSPVGADWFELTNTGASAVNISGWKMDDSSSSFASAVALGGVSSIAANQSVIFVEGNAATATSFISNWFDGSVPGGLAVGFYSGSGVGLGTSSDGVAIFDGGGNLQAKVSFGASDAVSPFQTFDNAAGLNNATISQLSVVGVNGAFAAANSAAEIGSPGLIAAVPEPETYAMLLAGLGLLGAIARRRGAR